MLVPEVYISGAMNEAMKMEMAFAPSIKRAAFAAAAARRASLPLLPNCRARFPSPWSLHGLTSSSPELQEHLWPSPRRAFCSSGTPSFSARGQVHSPLQASLQATEAEEIDSTALGEGLLRICTSMGLQDCHPGEHFSLAGKTVVWGVPSDWNMKWSMDGRFYEKYCNEEITQEWGYDGKNTWYADAGGRVSRMELDEGEVCLLTAWVRTGYWATEEGQKYLDIQLKPQASAAARELVYAIKLKKKEVMAHVGVDKNTCLPLRMRLQMYRQGQGWEFSNWQQVLLNRSCQLPMLYSRTSSSVTREDFRVVKVEVDPLENGSAYAFTDSLLRPRHHHRRYPRAQFDRSCPPYIQMTKARTGHYVVRPLINGRDVGYFIVDTGTGSLAITQRKARQLGLSSFGEVYATSISGGRVMSTRISRAASFQLGPLKLADPIFVEIGIDKLLKDAEGLCGFDIFHGSIVEMSHTDRTLSLFDPSEYEASSRGQGLQWQRMFLFDRVPHILAKVNGRDVMMMLDTGAAGPGLMFPSSAVHGFDNDQAADMPANLGRGRTLYVSQADYGNVQQFEIAGCSFNNVTALVPNKTGQQMGLSGYCAGVLCAEMVKNFVLVFDYTNRRMAFLDQRRSRSRF